EVARPEHSGQTRAAQPARDRGAFPQERRRPTATLRLIDARRARVQVVRERPPARAGVFGAGLPGVTRGNDTRAGPVIANPIFRRLSSVPIARSTARTSSG